MSLYPQSTASTTIPTAAALTSGSGTPTTTSLTSLIGQSTGYGEVAGLGATNAWLGALMPPDPTGNGFCWDSSFAQNNQQMAAGTWQPSVQLWTSIGSITADIIARVYVYIGGSFVSVGAPIVLLAQSITNVATVFTLPSVALPAAPFGPSGRLYLDLWLNITTNSTGSNGATVKLGGITTNGVGPTSTSWVTPSHTALTQTQLATRYAYGAFTFHDGISYFLLNKSLDMPTFQQTLFKIARFEGVKKTGEITNQRTVTLKIRVLGVSRADLEGKLDALAQAFSLRQQQLTLHSLDGRYFVADCISLSAPLQPGAILSTVVTATFICQQPYAYAASQSSFATGTFNPTYASGSNYQSGNYTLDNIGTIYSRPTIAITNQMTPNNSTLTSALTSGTNYTTLSVAALPQAAAVNQRFILNDGAGHTQTVVLSAGALAGATSVSVTSFNANFSYPASTTTVQFVTSITGLTVTNSSDGVTVSVSGLTTFTAGAVLTIVCDPIAANGYTVTINGGSPIAFSGAMPVIDATPTTWQVVFTCYNQPIVNVTWTWTPRYLN